MELKGVIFDLDGTVIADEDEYGESFKEILSNYGVKVGSDHPHVGGIGVKENWDIFQKKYQLKTKKSSEEMARETQKAYLKRLKSVDLKLGFEEFIDELKSASVLIALATSNDWWVVEEIIEKLKLEKYFSVITTTEEVKENKPDPEIFLISAEKLGLLPENCVVIEDSPAGIKAAYNANMKVVGIYRSEKLLKKLKDANLTIKDYRELSLEKIRNL
jgi:beta-phosphoglucomutase